MKLRIISALLAVAFICCGCMARPDESSSVPALSPNPMPAPKVLEQVNVPWFPDDSLNPYSCNTLQNYYLGGLLCDPLVALDGQQKPENRLALEVTAERNNYIIQLRHDAVFSDGSTLTAEDVLYSLELARLTPRFASGLSGVEKAEALDSGTVVITLKAPDIVFARSLTFPILKKDTAELSIPVGVGRFLPLTDQNLLVRNDTYYNPVKNLRQLSLVATDSLEAQSFAIMEGKIDLMYSDLQGDLNLGLGIGYRQIPLNNMLYLGVNGNKAGGELAVRQALSGLIDRDEISRKVYMGFAAATSLPINPSAAITSLNAADLEVNRPQQRTLLTQAGYTLSEDGIWKKGAVPLTFELLVNAENDERVSAAELIAHMYKSAGIPVTIVPLPFAQYQDRISKGEYDLYIGEVRLAYNMDISQLIFSGGSLNPAAPNLPELAALYADVRSGITESSLLEKQLRSDLPIIPLLFRRGILCFSRDFSANIVATEQDIFYNITDW
ncbi:MAG: ABC transporter substrate-binding protein [Angelakisella sp.]